MGKRRQRWNRSKENVTSSNAIELPNYASTSHEERIDNEYPENNEAEDLNENKPRKRKLHTYEKRKLAYEAMKAEKQRKFEEKQQRNIQRMEAMSAYQENKKRKMKKIYKRTRRGQPKLSGQVEFLLEKLQNQIEKT